MRLPSAIENILQPAESGEAISSGGLEGSWHLAIMASIKRK